MIPINDATITLIKRNEGCDLHAYQDMVGVWTIGYGHIEGVREGDTITQEQADQMLLDDLNNNYGPGVAARIGSVPTTANQFGALVSLAYNVGVGGVDASTSMRQHCAGNYQAAAAAFLLWDQAGGHVVQALLRRRHEEAALYLTPDVDVSPAPVQPSPTTESASIDLEDLQRRLAVGGFYHDRIDGEPGTETAAALWAYYLAHSPAP